LVSFGIGLYLLLKDRVNYKDGANSASPIEDAPNRAFSLQWLHFIAVASGSISSSFPQAKQKPLLPNPMKVSVTARSMRDFVMDLCTVRFGIGEPPIYGGLVIDMYI